MKTKLSGFIFSIILVIFLANGCAYQSAGVNGEVYKNPIPKTPQQAGIKTIDSTSCEGCHFDSEVIASFEKPKEATSGGETKGG